MKSGSDVFGTSVMKTEECVILVQAMNKNGSDKEQILADMELIDDLLSIQKMRVISRVVMFTKGGKIRKDFTMQGMIDNRLNLYLQEHANS